MMSNGVTFEQVEQLAVRLPPPEQLKLVARISEQLSSLMATIAPSGLESVRQEREAMADALLAELDAIAESIEGNFDSVDDTASIPKQIEQLAKLKEQGILSESEFEEKKHELLSRM